jgi:hypothetical protein
VRDPRHERVELVAYFPIPRRQFSSWGMSLLPFTDADSPVAANAADGSFSPYLLDHSALHMLIGRAQAQVLLQRERGNTEAPLFGT